MSHHRSLHFVVQAFFCCQSFAVRPLYIADDWFIVCLAGGKVYARTFFKESEGDSIAFPSCCVQNKDEPVSTQPDKDKASRLKELQASRCRLSYYTFTSFYGTHNAYSNESGGGICVLCCPWSTQWIDEETRRRFFSSTSNTTTNVNNNCS